MLRRRLFSAAMASVMALSTVAVVAQAEETKMVVTKDQLKELITVTYGDAWRADELSNYGSVSQAAMLDALEAADVILADGEAKADDYTVAYMMVEAVAKGLTIHTAAELQALIDECKPILETNNIYNEELNDLRYTAETFDSLEDAVGYAEGFVTSTSSADITEAYELLAKAKADLVKYDVVSKTMFRNVLKQYDEIIDNKFDYDTWRRGSQGWINTSNEEYWAFTSATSNAAFGHYYNYVLACKEQIVKAYDAIDAIKGLTKTTDADIYAGYIMAQEAVAVFNAWTVDNVNTATKSGLKALMNKYHGQLVFDYATSDVEELLAEIEAAVASLDTTNDEGDELGSVVEYMSGSDSVWSTTEIYETGWGQDDNDVVTDGSKAGYWKLINANATIKITADPDKKGATVKAIYVPVDENGYYDASRAIATTVAGKDDKKYKTISASSKFDLTTLIDISDADFSAATGVTANGARPADIDAVNNDTLDRYENAWTSEGCNPWGTPIKGWAAPADMDPATWDYSVSLETAMEIANVYLTGDKDIIKDSGVNIIDTIDDTGVVSVVDGAPAPNGSSKEYQLAYRYLYYALTEKYEGTAASGCSHTRADVKTLISDAWDLIDATGDAAIFNDANVDLAEARQVALDWVADANSDKLYKDHAKGTAADGNVYVTSDDAYHALENAYKQLMAEYNALKYSFGEIYDALAATAEKIDDGELEATDALLKAMNDVAEALSKVDVITYTSEADDDDYEDNAAFDMDRVFQANNRVITNSGDAQKILEIDGSVTTKDGANPTHAALVAAYDAMNAAIAAQAEADVLLGDANGDGALTAADASAILKYAVGLAEVDAKAADYNGDGAVTAADASAILKALVS